mgnify:CR=1 FL=1
MDQESIITIQEDLSEDFYALAQVQIDVVRKLLEEFEDDQLQATLELDAYERERRQKEAEQRAEQIKINDEDQQPEQGTPTQQRSE